MIDSRVVMVRTAQNDNSNSVFCLKLLQNFPALLAKDSVLEMIQRLVRLPGGSLTLSSRKPQDVYKLKVHLPLEQIGLTRIHQGIHILQPHIGKQIPFLDEGRLHGLGCGGHGGAGTVGLHIHEIRGKIVNHREEDVIERLLLVLYIEQVMHMRNTDLRREARVDRTPFRSRLVEFLGSVIRIDDILGLHAQGLEISAKQGVHRILVQRARDADADLGAILHHPHPSFLLRRNDHLRQRVCHLRRVVGSESPARSDFRHIGIRTFHRIQTLLDFPHGVDVFHQAFFATVTNDQPLDAGSNGNLRGLRTQILHFPV